MPVATNGEIGSESPQFMKHKCVFANGTYFFEKDETRKMKWG
jgi:hypothetical protein